MNVWQLEVQTVLQRNFGFKFHSSVATALNAGRNVNVAYVVRQVYQH